LQNVDKRNAVAVQTSNTQKKVLMVNNVDQAQRRIEAPIWGEHKSTKCIFAKINKNQRMLYFAVLCRQALVRTDASEERIASIIRASIV
jgi:hypothetical protein